MQEGLLGGGLYSGFQKQQVREETSQLARCSEHYECQEMTNAIRVTKR